jgi:rod shape-determining protein MreB and related proteins
MSKKAPWNVPIICIDMGTAETVAMRVGYEAEEYLVREASVVAFEKVRVLEKDQVVESQNFAVAVGNRAKARVEAKNQDTDIVYPVRDGVVQHTDAAGELIKYVAEEVMIKTSNGLFSKARSLFRTPSRPNFSKLKPVVIIGVPPICSDQYISTVSRAVYESLDPSQLYVVNQTYAAALGVGLSIWDPIGNGIGEWGGGTFNFSIISCNGIVVAKSVNLGGDSLNALIRDFIFRKYCIDPGVIESERLKIELGTAVCLNGNSQSAEIIGIPYDEKIVRAFTKNNISPGSISAEQARKILQKDFQSRKSLQGRNKVTISQEDIFQALDPQIRAITSTIREAIEDDLRTEQQLYKYIAKNRVALVGGHAGMHGITERFTADTGLNFYVPTEPHHTLAVIQGLGKLAEDKDLLTRAIAVPHRDAKN